MKKILVALLICVMTAALCLPVTAQNEALGFYDITPSDNLTVVPNGTPDETGFYADADRMTVTYTAATAGYEYLVLLVSGSGLPTASDDILYIDQKTAESETVTFAVYPLLEQQGELTLFITSNAPSFTTVSATMCYGEKPASYLLGDIDGNGAINTVDASKALQYYVNAEANPLDATQLLAADVDGNGTINTVDASKILQHYVGNCDAATCSLQH